MDEQQADTMNLARQVLGNWRGNGVAAFPTIPTFEYREELEFVTNDVKPYLRYEQRTWKKLETGEYAPSHWETGFWRVLPEGEIEVLSAQGGGRVEVLRGILEPTSEGFALNLSSALVGNDACINKTIRQFSILGRTLQYTMRMSTTAVPDLTLHVQATLTKSET
jgi:hypothetical protein